MKKAIQAAAALATAGAAFGGAIYGIFRYAFARNKQNQDLADIHYKPLEPYREEIDTSIKWFMDQNPEEVSITSDDGLKLNGWYLEHPNPKGLLILVHGYRGSWSTEFSCVYPYYYSLGFSMLTYWQRGHGTSEGDYITFGLKERYDCLRWIEYANSRMAGKLPVILDGISMGGATVTMAAGLELPENVCGVIADSGYCCPWDQIAHVIKSAHVPVRPTMDLINAIFRKKTGCDLRECNTLDFMPETKLPFLFLHGGDDHYVPYQCSQANYLACGAKDKTLLIVPGAIHGMGYLTDREECQRQLEAFLNRCTQV